MTDNKLTIHLTIASAPGSPRVPLEITNAMTGQELRTRAAEATKIPTGALKLIFRGRMVGMMTRKW